MLKVRDLVRVQCLRRKGIRPFGMITAVGEPEKGKQKMELNVNRERFHIRIDTKPKGRAYNGVVESTDELFDTRIGLYPGDEIRITRIHLSTFREHPLGSLAQPFYVDYGADGKITTRYGTISLKTGETELLDLGTGQLRDIDPETLAGNPSVNLYLCLSLDANRALPGDRLHPKIIQSKTRFVYGGLTATFINTILIHNGRLVQDCENGRNHFYLSSEKSLLCHLKDQVFYDFDRRVVCTLASTEVLVPVKARAEGIGCQGRMPLRNGSFF